jgi:hypothetical protein
MFILVGLVAAALTAAWAVFHTGRSRGPRIAITVLLVVIVLALAGWLALTRSATLGGAPSGIPSPYREIVLFVIMLAGMSARFLTRAIENRRERITAARAAGGAAPISIELDIWEFVYPMITSVLTFGLLLQQIGDGALSVATIVLAFQNGFFWQTLLGQVESRMSARTA